jgi:hypothetical protein
MPAAFTVADRTTTPAATVACCPDTEGSGGLPPGPLTVLTFLQQPSELFEDSEGPLAGQPLRRFGRQHRHRAPKPLDFPRCQIGHAPMVANTCSIHLLEPDPGAPPHQSDRRRGGAHSCWA